MAQPCSVHERRGNYGCRRDLHALMCSGQPHLLSSRTMHMKGETKCKTHKLVTALLFLPSPPRVVLSQRRLCPRRKKKTLDGGKRPKGSKTRRSSPSLYCRFPSDHRQALPQHSPFGSEGYVPSTSFQNVLSLRILICVRKRAE